MARKFGEEHDGASGKPVPQLPDQQTGVAGAPGISRMDLKPGHGIFLLVADKDPEPLRKALERDWVGQAQIRKLLSLRNERSIGPFASAIVKNRYDSFVALCQHIGNTNIEPRYDQKPKPRSEEKDNLLLTAIRYYNLGGKAVAEYILQNVSCDSAFIRYEPQKRSALHEAADKGYIDIFEALVKKAPMVVSRLFSIEDNLGRTPLHLAAQKGFCDIVRVLIQAVPKLELKKDHSFENALWKAVRMGRKEMIITLLEHRPDLIKSRNTPVGAAKTKTRGRNLGSKHISKSDIVGKSVYQLACETAKQGPIVNVADYSGGAIQGLQRRSTYDSSIRTLLKEYILRLQATSQEKRELLSKEERGKEIYLDLSLFNGFRPTENRFPIYLESLEDLEIEFLDYLEFVRLPNLSCEGGVPCKVAGPRGHRVDSEAKKVFAFLDRNKVDRVLRVTVPDCPIHPHSTSNIAECLDGLDLRVLDWRKVDLDLNMVLKVAPYLETIFLYSSGNRDVLKQWCGFEGLMQFEELKEVNIFIYPGEYSESELQILVQAVKARLERHQHHKDHAMLLRPEVSEDGFGLEFVAVPCDCERSQFQTVKVSVLSSQTESNMSANDLPMMGGIRHQESFFDKVRPIKEFLKLFHSSERPDCVYVRNRPVKVAIIDSGIAPNLDLDLYHVKGGKSFVEDTGSGTPDSHWHLVSNYHGSQLAQIVAATNPFCDIYAAKVYHGNARGGVDEDAAISAINWARQQGVDIIVMSWTVSEASAKDVGRLHKRFRKILHSASGKCLLFASTRDGASTNVMPFPASHSNVFAISSCPMDGRINHDIAKTDITRYYYLPGENFQLHVPKYLVAEGIKVDSGSSLATAAAAATASLILTCARFAFHEELPLEYESEYESRSERSRSSGRLPQLDGASPEGMDLSEMKEDIARIEDNAMLLEEDLSRRFDSPSDSESSEEDDDQDSPDKYQPDDDSRSESVASSHVRMKPSWLDPDLPEDNNAPAEKAFESLRTEEAMRAAFQDFSDTERRVKIWDYIGAEYAMMPMGQAKEKLREMLQVFVG